MDQVTLEKPVLFNIILKYANYISAVDIVYSWVFYVIFLFLSRNNQFRNNFNLNYLRNLIIRLLNFHFTLVERRH